MGKYLSTKGWKTLLANKDCKALKQPELEKLIVQFESAEKKADPAGAEAYFAKIKLKFRDLKKANAKNRTLIKWMDQADDEAEQIIAGFAEAPEAETKPAEKPAETAEAAVKPKPEEKPTETTSAKTEDKPAQKKEAEVEKTAPPSKEDAQRAKLGETLANELTLARRRSRDKAAKFVLNVDAKSPGLMLTRRELTPNLLKAAVFLSGKKGKTLKGVCYGESGKWIFAFSAEPSDVLIRLLKKAALTHAGMKLKLKVIGGGVELDDGEEPDAEEVAAAAPTADEAGAASAQPEAPSAQADDGSKKSNADPKELKNRLIAAASELKRALSGDKSAAETLDRSLAEITAAMKNKDFDTAADLIAALEARRTEDAPADVEEAAAPEQAAEARTDAQESSKNVVRDRFGEMKAGLAKLANIDAELYEALRADLAEAARLTEAGEVDAALDLIDAAELRMTKALPPSNVNFQKLRLRWQDGKKMVAASLEKLHGEIVTEFPDSEARKSGDNLDGVLAGFDQGLADKLDEMISADPGEARQAFKQSSLEIVGDYKTFVAISPLIDHVEINPFIPVAVREPLLQPLLLLEAELAKAGS